MNLTRHGIIHRSRDPLYVWRINDEERYLVIRPYRRKYGVTMEVVRVAYDPTERWENMVRWGKGVELLMTKYYSYREHGPWMVEDFLHDPLSHLMMYFL